MGKKLVVLGDTHFKHEEPFFSMQKSFIEWFADQPFNNEKNLFLSLGDLFDKYNPSPKVNDLVLDFFNNKMKFSKKNVLAGNYKHEFDIRKRTWAIDILSSIPDVLLFKSPTEWVVDNNIECLVLPWYYKTVFPEFGDMKKYYENLPEGIAKKQYAFIFGHITDVDIFGEIVNIDYLKGKKILGHVHSKNFGKSFLGSPYILSKNEQGEDKQLLLIDLETKELEYVKIPKFLDYYKVTYPNEVKIPTNCEYPIFEIYKAPSIDIAKEKYKNLIIKKNGIHLEKSDTKISLENSANSDKLSIKEHFENFEKENKIDKEVSNLIREVL